MKVIKEKLGLPSILRMIPLLVALVLLTWFMVTRGASAVTTLVDSFEDHIWLTTAALLGLFLLKSVSFGLPFALLYIGVGSIYPFGWALVVNIVGIAINMQIPYFLGRYTGGTFVEKMVGKFPRLGRLEAFSQHSSFLFSFMTKFIGKIPHEITNALLGSLKVPYLAYMTGGILGLCPTMIATTLVAASLDQIGSPLFYISLVVVVVLTLVSFLLYRRFGDTNG